MDQTDEKPNTLQEETNESGTAKSLWGKLKAKGEDLSTKVAEVTKEAYEKSGVDEKINEASSAFSESDAGKKIISATETVGEKLDEATGSKLLKLLESRLEKQDYYNDVLATKLSDALERISSLEKKLEGNA